MKLIDTNKKASFFWSIFFVFLATSCSNNTPTNIYNSLQKDSLSSTSNNKNTEYIEYYDNGKIRMQGKLVNGKREGLWKSYYENGALWSTGFYVNGKRQGLGIVLYNNGKKFMEGEYKNDKRFGKWIFYNEKGEVIKEEFFN